MKYTPTDLDRMRRALWDIETRRNRAYTADDMRRTVEAMLLTYMMNETLPDELEAHNRTLAGKDDV